jgi:GINS complex subunit 2
LRDLREVRQAKARKGIETVGDTHLQMDNLGLMEISEIRFLSKALDQLRQLNAVRADSEGGGLGTDSNGDMDDSTTWDE